MRRATHHLFLEVNIDPGQGRVLHYADSVFPVVRDSVVVPFNDVLDWNAGLKALSLSSEHEDDSVIIAPLEDEDNILQLVEMGEFFLPITKAVVCKIGPVVDAVDGFFNNHHNVFNRYITIRSILHKLSPPAIRQFMHHVRVTYVNK